MCVCVFATSITAWTFFPDCVCGIALTAMNKSSTVPSICLHIFPTIINLLYQLITFQSFSLCATCRCCYSVFIGVRVLTVSLNRSHRTACWLQACCVSMGKVCLNGICAWFLPEFLIWPTRYAQLSVQEKGTAFCESGCEKNTWYWCFLYKTSGRAREALTLIFNEKGIFTVTDTILLLLEPL